MGKENVRKLFEDMAREAGLTQEEASRFVAMADNERLANIADNNMKRHADWSSAIDKARNLEDKARKADEWEQWSNQNWGKITQYMQERDELAARMQALQQAGWSPAQAAQQAANEARQQPGGSSLSISDIENAVVDVWRKKIAPVQSDVMKQIARIASSHAARFGEGLDVDAIEEIANKRGVPIAAAYSEWIAPREKQLADAEQERVVEQKVKERLAQERTKTRRPDGGAQGMTSPFFSRQKPGESKTQDDIHDELVGLLENM